MNERVDIYELVKRCPDATIQIRVSDLSFFGRKLLADARLEFERQQAQTSSDKAETYLDAETVLSKLGISASTLYRLGKAQVIKTYRLAGRRKYRLSDIEKLMHEEN